MVFPGSGRHRGRDLLRLKAGLQILIRHGDSVVLAVGQEAPAIDDGMRRPWPIRVKEVRDRLGKTVVIITHNAAIGRMADRVVRLRSGEVVEIAVHDKPESPEELSW